MLAKVINLNKAVKNVGFAPAVKYIFRDDKANSEKIEGGQFNLDCDIGTKEDRKTMIDILNHDASKVEKNGRFKGNPVYHYSLSWKEDEHPTAKQIHDAVEHTLMKLGMEECQATYAIHRDTDNHHVHVLVNRVHPTKSIIVGPPQKDFLILDKAMREIELTQGWKHDAGPHVVQYNGNAPTITRMTKTERAAQGISILDPNKMRASQQAIRSEKNSGAPSFQAWLNKEVSAEVLKLLKQNKPNWRDLHLFMLKRGCSIEAKGSGLIIKTELDGRTLTAKASQMHHDLGKNQIEKKLGKFEAVDWKIVADKKQTYGYAVQQYQSDIKHDCPGLTGNDDPKRIQKRTERAVEREALYLKYKHHQTDYKEERREQKSEMRLKHAEERQELYSSFKAQKTAFIASQKMNGITGQAAHSLWTREKMVQVDALKEQHKQERQSFSVNQPAGAVWRTWLEREAQKGNEAAKSALRGIRYREGQGKEQNSISGEEVEPLKPAKTNGISSLTSEFNQNKQTVIYRDERGDKRITDEGQRLIVHDKSEGTLETALELAQQKYGRDVYLTGTAEFREAAARECARQNIWVEDKDLQVIWNDEKYGNKLGIER